MEIREIAEKKAWEDFVLGEKARTFLQSWNWGEFNVSTGNKIWRLGVYEAVGDKHQETRLVGAALVVKIQAKRGTFLFVPQGPVTSDKYQASSIKEIFRGFTDYLKGLALEERCGFIRISPILAKNHENEILFKEAGFRRAPIHMHAELMWMLDIAPSEEIILKGMRKTTRYLVKKAQTDGVKILSSSESQHVSIFNNIYEETAKRQGFKAFSRQYLGREFNSFVSDDQISIFLAEWNGEFIAGAMVIFYGESAFYHQGASLQKYPKIPAPYLLQWEIIREAKRRGMKLYNFWGISPSFANASAGKPDDKAKKHPWDGLSLFKTGFGGFAEELMPAQDLALAKKYWITYGIERIRRAKRGL